jgi:starch phosphorylase
MLVRVKAIRRFTVRAVLPDTLSALEEIAGNLRWSWHEPTKELFARISPELWQEVEHDPIALLGSVEPARLAELAGDQGYVDWANHVRDELRAYIHDPRWYQSLGDSAPAAIAYFSPEFGIASSLPQYSGGLGILAGDHLKAASDLGAPLVAVGLFYRSGYFAQAITPDGWQLESYPALDPDGLPLSVLRDPDGAAVQITLALPAGELRARVWQAAVGRVTLLLLDTDIPENDESLRSVTDRLYGGGGEHRLLQELLLGIGGVRAVKAWAGLTGAAEAEVFHTNEGHAGFLGLERISDLIGEGLTFDEALQVVRAGTVFTTHTPVPAGIDRFDRSLVERYFSTSLLPGVEPEQVLALGAEDYPGGSDSVYNMAVMGLRLGQHANGVSRLHGEVSRQMFGGLFPGFDSAEVPIDSVTNGVHAQTWTDPMLRSLAVERLGTDDTTHADWANAGAVTDLDLWSVRTRMREQLVKDARHRVAAAWESQNPGGIAPVWINDLLDPNVLTIGFARRVPTYKRLTLMLHDPERLKNILLHPERPVQFVIAGKSHPADDEGKRLIQKLVQFASEPEIRARMVFLPDYDIGMAQQLYPGTDVWLNNPLRPLEACGTSGMKAALNGALNLSILDGWWNEFYDGENGWAIPSADAAGDGAERDALEAEAMYDLIEHQIAPRFYDRDGDGVPATWVGQIRHTLATLSSPLSAERMVREYVERLYMPAAANEKRLSDDDYRAARELAAWKDRVRSAWPGVNVAHVDAGGLDDVPQVGDELRVRALVHLNGLRPEDVEVQLVYGRSLDGEDLTGVHYERLELEHAVPGADPSVAHEFAGRVTLTWAGSFGYTVRVVPVNDLLLSSAELGLVAAA